MSDTVYTAYNYDNAMYPKDVKNYGKFLTTSFKPNYIGDKLMLFDLVLELIKNKDLIKFYNGEINFYTKYNPYASTKYNTIINNYKYTLSNSKLPYLTSYTSVAEYLSLHLFEIVEAASKAIGVRRHIKIDYTTLQLPKRNVDILKFYNKYAGYSLEAHYKALGSRLYNNKAEQLRVVTNDIINSFKDTSSISDTKYDLIETDAIKTKLFLVLSKGTYKYSQMLLDVMQETKIKNQDYIQTIRYIAQNANTLIKNVRQLQLITRQQPNYINRVRNNEELPFFIYTNDKATIELAANSYNKMYATDNLTILDYNICLSVMQQLKPYLTNAQIDSLIAIHYHISNKFVTDEIRTRRVFNLNNNDISLSTLQYYDNKLYKQIVLYFLGVCKQYPSRILISYHDLENDIELSNYLSYKVATKFNIKPDLVDQLIHFKQPNIYYMSTTDANSKRKKLLDNLKQTKNTVQVEHKDKELEYQKALEDLLKVDELSTNLTKYTSNTDALIKLDTIRENIALNISTNLQENYKPFDIIEDDLVQVLIRILKTQPVSVGSSYLQHKIVTYLNNFEMGTGIN